MKYQIGHYSFLLIALLALCFGEDMIFWGSIILSNIFTVARMVVHDLE